jgi:hypothetical protein
MEMKTPKKRLNKKEQLEIQREQDISELLKRYVEGESNLDISKLDIDDYWKIAFTKNLSVKKKEKLIGKPLPLISQEEWLDQELAKIEAARRKEPPPYRVQDPIGELNKYRQKFVEKLKEIEPQAIEDLRKLAPYFENLFYYKIKKDYIHILQELGQKLIFKKRIYPYNYVPVNLRYVWGELETALFWTQRYCIAKYTDYKFDNQELVEEIIEDNKYNLQSIEQMIESHFQKTAKNKSSIVFDFLILQTEIYCWINKYNLHKDWMFYYAYYFISQFGGNKDISLEDLRVEPRLHDTDLQYYDFEFRTKGWLASEYGEPALEYKARVKKEFEKQLDDYIDEAADRMKLGELKNATGKPPTYKNVEWLAYSLIKGFTAEGLVEKYYKEVTADKTKDESSYKKFENKKKHIESEVKKLQMYDLPESKSL